MERKQVKQVVVNGKTYEVIGIHYNMTVAPVVYMVNEKMENGHYRLFSRVDKVIYE